MNALARLLPAGPLLKPTIALFATTFVAQLVGLSYSAFQIEPAPAVSLLEPLAFLWAVCWWFEAEAKHARVQLPMDTGMLLYVAWFVLIPIYLIKTRGLKGLWGIAAFIATILVAWAMANLIILLVWY